jgi:hypothetical protein
VELPILLLGLEHQLEVRVEAARDDVLLLLLVAHQQTEVQQQAGAVQAELPGALAHPDQVQSNGVVFSAVQGRLHRARVLLDQRLAEFHAEALRLRERH